MAEDNIEKHKIIKLEFAEGYEVYAQALAKAYRERDEIVETEKQLAYRKTKLNETIDALIPLVFKRVWDINTLGLSDAIRFVFNNARRPLSPLDIRSKLEDLGYNLKQFENPLASIHTALRRMGETDELYPVESEDKKKMFEPGPELKSIPEPKKEINTAALIAAISGLSKSAETVKEGVEKQK
jgi:hypothetical protein